MVPSTLAPRTDLEAHLASSGGTPHLVQFYDDEPFLSDVLARFVLEGLRRSEPALVIAAASRRDVLLHRLRDSGLEVDGALERGQLVMHDAGALLGQFMTEGQPDAARFQAAMVPVLEALQQRGNGARIRAYGEMVDILWREGNARAALQLEALWNELARDHAFSLLCAYGMQNFRKGEDAAAFIEVCSAHSHVLPSEEYARIESSEDRLRRICALEQRARALENEVELRNQMEKELMEALRVREDFLSVAGHELKTPLTAMKLQMDSLLGLAAKDGSERLVERVERLRRHASRLGTLVEDLLDVSRLSAGRFTLNPQEVDLSASVREVAHRFEETAAQTGSQLRLLAEGQVVGHWDPLRIEQIVTHLLTNAFKYGAGKPIDVSVLSTRTRAKLVVKDSGPGIPLEHQARIFNRFERAEASRNYGGLGLGLWIARQVVEAHGGTIRVESELEEGATFTVELPLKRS